jgi:hypothetical protein
MRQRSMVHILADIIFVAQLALAMHGPIW